MKRFNDPDIRLILLGISVLVGLAGGLLVHSGVYAQNDAVVLVAHNSVPGNALSKTDVQNIFLGKKTKLESAPISIILLKEGELHEQFLKDYLSRTPDQYLKYWKKLIFTGEGKAPKTVATEEELVQYVAATEGAIGYVSAVVFQKQQGQNIHQLTVQ